MSGISLVTKGILSPPKQGDVIIQGSGGYTKIEQPIKPVIKINSVSFSSVDKKEEQNIKIVSLKFNEEKHD